MRKTGYASVTRILAQFMTQIKKINALNVKNLIDFTRINV